LIGTDKEDRTVTPGGQDLKPDERYAQGFLAAINYVNEE
jgi:hypothetical protein